MKPSYEELEAQTKQLKIDADCYKKGMEAETDRANREHHRGFMMACKHLEEHANIHYADAAEMEIAALRQRIAELREWNAGLAQESFTYQQRVAELDNSLCELLPGTQYMDPPDGGNVTPLEQVRRMIADYRHRIAELEAREVKLPAEKFCPAEYAGSQLWEETEIWNKAVQSCEDAIRAVGIKFAAAGKGE